MTANLNKEKAQEKIQDVKKAATPVMSQLMAKIPAVKAKVHAAIAKNAPVVKEKLSNVLDNLTEYSDKAKDVEAEKAKEAQAKADELSKEAEAEKATEAAAKAQEASKKKAATDEAKEEKAQPKAKAKKAS